MTIPTIVFLHPGEPPELQVARALANHAEMSCAGGYEARQQIRWPLWSRTPGKINGRNLRIRAPWKRKNMFQTIIFRFYVNLRGCIFLRSWELYRLTYPFPSHTSETMIFRLKPIWCWYVIVPLEGISTWRERSYWTYVHGLQGWKMIHLRLCENPIRIYIYVMIFIYYII